jgi:two-component system chemotaxis response regulator CheY
MRVLVTDDARFMREMIREILESAGFEVVGEASTGEEAVEAFQTLQPDLVTMDIVMPGCSGIEAVRRILALDPDARVVMVSSLGQESLVMEALRAGAQDFVVKPFKPERVVAILRKTLAAGG